MILMIELLSEGAIGTKNLFVGTFDKLDVFNQNWSNEKVVQIVFPTYGRFSMRHNIDYNW